METPAQKYKGSTGVPGQVPCGARSAGTGAVLGGGFWLGCATGRHAKIGGTHNAFQFLGPAFGAFHLYLVVICAHYQDLNIFLTF
jgi:hypothetical protein